MPNIAKLLKDEFARLGRREANRNTAKLKRRVLALEKIVRAQRATLEDLRRTTDARLAQVERAAAGKPAAAPAGDGARLSPRLIKALRKRLKLSQTAFAQLTGVTHVAVYLWESGKTKPRGTSREAIIGLRGVGVREVKRRLDDAKVAKTPSKARGGAKRTAKRAGKATRSMAVKDRHVTRR